MNARSYRLGELPSYSGVTSTCNTTQKDGVEYLHITVSQEREALLPPLTLRIYVPASGVHARWTPKLNLIKALNLDWFRNLYITNAFTGAPVECLIGEQDKNYGCLGLSDTMNTIGITALPAEETAEYEFEIILFQKESKLRKNYDITIRLDLREVPYYEALAGMSKWWESLEGLKPAAVPEEAREIMYSTWYSYHQRVSQEVLIKECRLARELGCRSILVDDGWQTEDNGRGYAYCGDWEAAETKFPDVRKFTDTLHDMGMKVMFWYSVPFIGEKSKNYARFWDMLIDPEADRMWHVLDPRYPQVREFIIGLYEEALDNWGLDGFKLDFVDEFVVTPFSGREQDERRDYESFEEAADCLLTDCIKRLKQKKPDILLEFRQTYNGPKMRTYGNIFRAVDCPLGDVENKIRVTDIRLLSGQSAVHSDMLMWNLDDTPESAAKQIIAILFSVPQISVRIEELSEAHYKMLKFYCGLWQQYKEAFVKGRFLPYHLKEGYSVIMGQTEDTLVCTYYASEILELSSLYKKMVFVNGTDYNRLLIQITGEADDYNRRTFDCMGNMISKEDIRLEPGYHICEVPVSGCVIFEKMIYKCD